MTVRRYMAWLLMVIAVGLVLSCDKKSTNPDGELDEWFPPEVGLAFQYRLYDTPTIYSDVPAEVMAIDSQTYPGETLVKLQLGVFNETVKRGIILWLKLSKLNEIGYRAAEIYYGDAGKKQPKSTGTASEDWDVKEVWSPALTLEYTGKTGDTGTSASTATFYFNGDMTSPEEYPSTLEYTIASKNASVTVPYGTVTGCIQLDLTFTQTDDWGPFSFDGQYFIKPGLGLVKAVPIPGYYGAELISD